MGLANEFADGIDEIFAEFYQATVGIILRNPQDGDDEETYLEPIFVRAGLRSTPRPEEATGDEFNLWKSSDITILVPRRTLIDNRIEVNGQEAMNFLTKSRFTHETFGIAQCYEVQRSAFVDNVFLLWRFLCRVISDADY
jgi:hypothetical protein